MTFNIVAMRALRARWRAMLRRCNNPKDRSYKNYGARGIDVCNRWYFFENFVSDMGLPPDGLELDRIDNNKGYSPENCRWTSRVRNSLNQRRTVLVAINGAVRPLADFADGSGIKIKTIKARIKDGWEPIAAIRSPTRAGRLIELRGQTKTLAEWCRIYKVDYGTTHIRISKGMAPLEALTTPNFQGRRACSQ